ncbi:hypothetical protein K438DRAFT_1979782 [Mycena galopus ATCC 62051]|nr:hypothetical protein K438DRAFT_1979782 [Mycena galopus ATCC 62051]
MTLGLHVSSERRAPFSRPLQPAYPPLPPSKIIPGFVALPRNCTPCGAGIAFTARLQRLNSRIHCPAPAPTPSEVAHPRAPHSVAQLMLLHVHFASHTRACSLPLLRRSSVFYPAPTTLDTPPAAPRPPAARVGLLCAVPTCVCCALARCCTRFALFSSDGHQPRYLTPVAALFTLPHML